MKMAQRKEAVRRGKARSYRTYSLSVEVFLASMKWTRNLCTIKIVSWETPRSENPKGF